MMNRRLRLIEHEQRMLAARDPHIRLAALERRVAALEALIGEKTPAHPHPAQPHLPGGPLREQIRQLLKRDAGPKHGAAKRALRLLADTDIGRSEQPSLRTVQWHITQLRKHVGLHD